MEKKEISKETKELINKSLNEVLTEEIIKKVNDKTLDNIVKELQYIRHEIKFNMFLILSVFALLTIIAVRTGII